MGDREALNRRRRAALVGVLGAALFVFPSYPFTGSGVYLSALGVGALLSSLAAYLSVLED